MMRAIVRTKLSIADLLLVSLFVVFQLIYGAQVFAQTHEWVKIPAGQFRMGDKNGDANEAPTIERVQSFELLRFEVTNDQYQSFVKNTGYVSDTIRNGKAHVWTRRWHRDSSASFLQPHGLESSIKGMEQHPVTQVSARDAATYCMYLGARLPTEKEWEFAARGTDGRLYPWGNQRPQQSPSNSVTNFGTEACCAPSDTDGFATTAPVGSYPGGVSPFGIEDMAGNVWEWTSTVFPGRADQRVIRGGGWGNNAYCLRTSYRHGNPPDIGLNMVGFRCAR